MTNRVVISVSAFVGILLMGSVVYVSSHYDALHEAHPKYSFLELMQDAAWRAILNVVFVPIAVAEASASSIGSGISAAHRVFIEEGSLFLHYIKEIFGSWIYKHAYAFIASCWGWIGFLLLPVYRVALKVFFVVAPIAVVSGIVVTTYSWYFRPVVEKE